ncbi:short-chain fatty acid transporter [Psychrobacter sanguinis]|uniref:Short-chain fatty acid transporter n=1 Tax=Psychrobacter sanguinis TaxID=861445 RepID=A0A844M1M9_9GAMM|nr:TIGR00366 family protein [Psychrobacter sanguinis]MUG32859.1 short-chain fatty acid transporter [Psychrobacter sanguinis]
MNSIINFSVKLTQKYLPDTYILAIILTVIVFLSGMIFAGQSPIEMSNHWGEGFSSLFNFGMQMALVLITGFTLAQTPIVKKLLGKITTIPKTPRQSIILVALVSFVSCYINWAFGLVVGALLAREMGRRVKGVHFPLIVAAAYSGEIIRGPSSSIPLVIATPGHFMEEQIGIISVSQTLFSSWNIAISALILLALVTLFAFIKVKKEDVIEFVDDIEHEDVKETQGVATSFAERLENSRVINWILAIIPILFIGDLIISGSFSLNLDTVIIIFLALALILQKNPMAFLDTVKDAVVAARGIIIQFPLYAGVAGMMASSGLVDIVATAFINAATPETFPLMTFLSAGLVNFFIPSGGGQWAVQGPVMMQAAYAMGADIPQSIMAFAWGDAWTNQIQPFWALPLLGVAGLSARDIMGYCLIWFALSGVIVSGVFIGLTIFA